MAKADPAIRTAQETIRRLVEAVGGTCMGSADHAVLYPAPELRPRTIMRPRIEIYFFDEGSRVDYSTGWFISHSVNVSEIGTIVEAIIDGRAEERLTLSPAGELLEEGWAIWGTDLSIGERKPARADLLVHRLPAWETIRQTSAAPGVDLHP